MTYKDKDKQREANRQAKRAQRRRDGRRQPKGMTPISPKGMTSPGTTEGMTVSDEPSNVIPKTDIRVIPKGTAMGITTEPLDMSPKRGKDIKCLTKGITEALDGQRQQRSGSVPTTSTAKMTVMERLFYRPVSQLGRGETNFVSLPGRACYGVV